MPSGRPRREPTPEEARAATRPVLWFSLLLLVAVLLPLTGAPWPLPLFSGVLAVAALGLGVYAFVRIKRTGVRGAVVPVLILSLVLATYLALSSVVQLLLWPAYSAYAECTDRAVTVQAGRACVSELEDAIRDRFLG